MILRSRLPELHADVICKYCCRTAILCTLVGYMGQAVSEGIRGEKVAEIAFRLRSDLM